MTRRRPLDSLEDLQPEEAYGRDISKATTTTASGRRTHQLLRLTPMGIRGVVLFVAIFATVSLLLVMSHMGDVGRLTVATNGHVAMVETTTAAYEEGADTDEVEEQKSHALEPPAIQEQNAELWRQPVEPDRYYKCINRSKHEKKMGSSNGYLLVHANGGLNQMKIGISDMVAVTKIMNATLVLPTLDSNSFWTDSSNFKALFDWKHFMEVLKEDIHIVESLPSGLTSGKALRRAPVSWSKPVYYRRLVPLLRKNKLIHFTKTDSRLVNNGLAGSIQKLRCRAMYEALWYSDDIRELANKFVKRLRENNQHYIALHLRC
ncbi:hypothetical protein SAY86_021915 [Trapa natans]|uniref:O-fucosyltransferase family protein n=1 Tax=Trapa natans TaxID=22666 RepID=A0AAN7MZX6_TRANT|nr:hypothetical protein SAY86_021915 [Trapa natans]